MKRRLFIFCLLIFSLLFLNLSFPLQALESNEEEDFFVAQKAFQDGFFSLSLDILTRFLERYPYSSHRYKAQFLIARCLFYQGQFRPALEKFQELTAVKEAEAFKDELLYWIGEVHFKGSDYKKAADFYQQVIDSYPDSQVTAKAYYNLTLSLFNLKDYQQVLNTIETMLTAHADFEYIDTLYFKQAEALFRLDKREKAKDKFLVFIKDHTGHKRISEANFFLGEIEYKQNSFQSALNFYEKAHQALNKEPQAEKELLSAVISGMGWSYLALDKIADARNVFSNAPEDDTILLGRAAIESKQANIDSALRLYEQIIERFPGSEHLFEAVLGKADALYTLGEFQEAVSVYNYLINSLSKEKRFKEFEYKIYYGLAWSYLKAGQYEEAIESFEKIASSSTDEIIKVSALCQLGDAYQEAGEFEKALQMYDRILNEYPDTLYGDYVQFQSAVTLFKAKKPEAAVLSFGSLLERFPKTKLKPNAIYYLGLIQFQTGAFEQSVESFKLFLKEYKDSNLKADALYLLACSLYNLKEYKQALGVFERIFKENVKRNERLSQAAEYEIANCLFQLGKEQEALQRLRAFLKKHPDSSIFVDILYWIGEYYLHKDNFEVARRYMRRIVNEYPQHELKDAALYNIGLSYMESERFRAALKVFAQVRDSSNKELAFNAALSMVDMHIYSYEFSQALDILNKLIPDDNFTEFKTKALIKRGDILRKDRDFKNALLNYEQALEISGKDIGVLFKIAEVFEESGKHEKALESFLKLSYEYGQDELSLKSLLRAARICEITEKWDQAAEIYLKIKSSNAPEAQYAAERLEALEKFIKP